MTIYERASDTAKKVRLALREAFPHLPARHFSVTTSNYSGGSSLRVSWEDTPSYKAVDEIVAKFKSASFNGMDDSTEYHGYTWTDGKVYSGAHYTILNKVYSDEREAEAKAIYARDYGGSKFDYGVLEKISCQIDDAKAKAATAPAKAPKMGMQEFIQAVYNAMPHEWFRGKEAELYLNLVIKADVENPDVRGFLEQELPRIKAFTALAKLGQEADEKLGYSFDYLSVVEQIVGVTQKSYNYAVLTEGSLENSMSALRGIFIAMFAHLCKPHAIVEADEQVIAFARQMLATHYNNHPPMLRAMDLVRSDAFIEYKTLVRDEQRRAFIFFLEKEAKRIVETEAANNTTPDNVNVKWEQKPLDSYDRETADKVRTGLEELAAHPSTGELRVSWNSSTGYCVVRGNGVSLLFHPYYVGSLVSPNVLFNRLAGGVSYEGGDSPTAEEAIFLTHLAAPIVAYIKAREQQKPEATALTEEEKLRMARIIKVVNAHKQNGVPMTMRIEVRDGFPYLSFKENSVIIFVNPRGILLATPKGTTSVIKRKSNESYACFDDVGSVLNGVSVGLTRVIQQSVVRGFDLRYKVER